MSDAIPLSRERPILPSPRSALRARLINLGSTGVVLGVHGLCLLTPFVALSWRIAAISAGCYVLQVLGITAGYHRYFSHRAFRTSRIFQFVLAWLGCSAMQNGPLWWASGHRRHHRFSDKPGDPHSPVLGGFWHAHLGWVLDGSNDHPDLSNVRDFTGFVELRLLDEWKWVPTLVTGVASVLLFGWPGLVWVFGVATTLAFHAPLFVNSLGHLRGRQRFETNDSSRNNALLGVLVLGEGWHNNHHHAQGLARHGLAWWEIDVTYYAIRALQLVRVVWCVREPGARVARDTSGRRVSRASPASPSATATGFR
jgi:stearoyl-CoA desaturase (delta-9 desaturase)